MPFDANDGLSMLMKVTFDAKIINRRFNISLVKVQTKPRLQDKGIKLSEFVNKPVNVGFR